jgi:hypothetical protein
VKGDVVSDTTGASNSLNWRHKINKVGEEVVTTELFFKRIIRQMVSGTYTSYDGTPKCYTNAATAATLKVRSASPAVYMSKVALDAYVLNLLAVIRVDMNTKFLFPYKHIWPECINHDDDHDDDEQVVHMNQGGENIDAGFESDDQNREDKKQILEDAVDENVVDGVVEAEIDDEDGGDIQVDDDVDPTDERGWESWGTINHQNQVVGKRKSNPVNRFVYDQRRRATGRYPDPKM